MFGRKKKLDFVTKNGMEAWLRLSIDRFSADPSLYARFKHALSEFEKDNYEEAKLSMEMLRTIYDNASRNKGLTMTQLTEDCTLKVWLEELEKLH